MMMRKLAVLAVAIALALGFLLAEVSPATDGQQKITVTSKQQSIDYANRILVFQEEVKANWENYTVEADKAEIYLAPDDTLKKIIATGNVRITEDAGIQGSCQIITYLPQENLLILEGNVKYQDDIGNSIEAQKVTIWTLEERLEAEGDPVKAIYILREEEEDAAPGGESK
ncbi:hypothetical protein IBX65_02295 [Candidatus Aerophobetes bacterium]|nr:hypothetical protein [Candidatus Aerophobetes bacterium]